MLLSGSQNSLELKGDLALMISLALADDFCVVPWLGQGSTVDGT